MTSNNDIDDLVNQLGGASITTTKVDLTSFSVNGKTPENARDAIEMAKATVSNVLKSAPKEEFEDIVTYYHKVIEAANNRHYNKKYEYQVNPSKKDKFMNSFKRVVLAPVVLEMLVDQFGTLQMLNSDIAKLDPMGSIRADILNTQQTEESVDEKENKSNAADGDNADAHLKVTADALQFMLSKAVDGIAGLTPRKK